MVNKNDTSDLANFFGTAAGIICFIVAFLIFSFILVDNKYGQMIRFYYAKISDYAHRQWQAGENPLPIK